MAMAVVTIDVSVLQLFLTSLNEIKTYLTVSKSKHIIKLHPSTGHKVSYWKDGTTLVVGDV